MTACDPEYESAANAIRGRPQKKFNLNIYELNVAGAPLRA